MSRKRLSAGERLWLNLYRAEAYDRESGKIEEPTEPLRAGAARATKRWLQGMARHLKETFGPELRRLREEVGLTQQGLANLAGLTATAVAMIERGEHLPGLVTAARLCWALDVASGQELTAAPSS